MYPEVCNFSWIYTLLYPGNVHWSASPLCVNVCVRKCLHREENVCKDVRMYAVIFAMKLCGSVCVFFYKIAVRKSSWPPKKKKKKKNDINEYLSSVVLPSLAEDQQNICEGLISMRECEIVVNEMKF